MRLLSVPYHADKCYDYLLPAEQGFVGAFVIVPFGSGNRTSLGVIVGLHDEPDTAERTVYKTVDIVYDREYSLDGEFLRLAGYLSDTTLCSFAEAVKTIYPVALLGTLRERYERTDKAPGDINSRALAVYDYVVSHPDETGARIRESLGDGAMQAIRYLTDRGCLRIIRDAAENCNVAYEEFYAVSDAPYATKSEKLRGALSYLAENGETEKRALLEKTGINASQLRRLREAGAVKLRRVEKYRRPYLSCSDAPEVTLTSEQQSARDEISSLIKEGKPAAALLYGVTGSGKTLVIKSLCDEVIASGRQVIMLVPEIALTPQSVRIFSSFYKERVAVIHSGLSEGERLDVYKRIKSGAADMVIGTRSAAFAPVPNLGLFVIDEEQEHTYKSDSDPKYRAHDVGRFRCAENNAVLLLASATPSIESFYRAQTGRYRLVRLENRYGGARLPQVEIADLRVDYASGRTDPIGSALEGRLKQTLEDNAQSILFLNRRGYSTFLSCKMCGEVVMCPHCDVSMTYHKDSGGGYLMCHYCGCRTPAPRVCPKCGSEHIGYMGYGTQKLHEELSTLLPDARVLRMDADTTGTKSAYDRILGDFRERKADILLGTQMVTKGHDFPNVTTVGVIMADNALYLEDYHAQERTFCLLTQVIGRAGRAEKPGVAVIQTLNPEHEVIKLAAAQDYEGFYKGEIAMRKALTFPPFCDIVLFSFTSTDERQLSASAGEFCGELNEQLKGEYSDVKLVAFGPFEAQLYRINGVCRMQLVCKCKANKRTRELFAQLLKKYTAKYARRVSFGADVNPNQL